MNHILTNWKTTSAGLAMIIASVMHLVFAVKSGIADETTWTRDITAIVGGVGLIFAGDATQSKKEVDQAKDQVKTAIETQDTSHITKSDDAPKV